MKKPVLITGATGLVGKKITEKLISRGEKVIAVTRNSAKAKALLNDSCSIAEWDFNSPSDNLLSLLSEAGAVIHLAGENVLSKKWTPEHKKNIYNSRVNSTKVLSELILKSGGRPEVFISASAVGYYGISSTAPADEYAKCADDFLARLVKDWENASLSLDEKGIRRVQIRTGIVLDEREGALSKMIPAFKYFAGGPLGNGKQFFPWIHLEDTAGLYIHALYSKEMKGAYNAAAPETITMKDFCSVMGKVMRRPSFFRVPPIILKMLYGEGASILLGGINVMPVRSLESGYEFSFTDSKSALENIL